MTWKKLREEMEKYRKELESRLHNRAKFLGMYVGVWLQENPPLEFSLEAFMRTPEEPSSEHVILGFGATIRELFADARESFINGTLAKYLKKPKTSGSTGKKKHK